MTSDPFAAVAGVVDAPDPARVALRAAGPIVQVRAPAGGPAWIVTDHDLAREVLADPRIAKDPAHAPPGWDRYTAGLEPTAAEQASLTTLDGPAHTELRRAHAPMFTPKRMREHAGRAAAIARDLLTELADTGGTVDLMAGFTTRYPLSVLIDLLGGPLEGVDQAARACRGMYSDDPDEVGRAMGGFAAVAASALRADSNGLAAQLRDRLPATATRGDLHYHLFGLIFAGQLTTDAALGFLLARVLGVPDARSTPVQELVDETLRTHPPAPFGLWRFTTTDVDLGDTALPAGSPVLVDIQGINAESAHLPGPGLSFGFGPHYCIGAQLAQLELRAVVEVLRTDFPNARLDGPYSALRSSRRRGIDGPRVDRLPVTLRG